jgi:2'-5' RNA ligase
MEPSSKLAGFALLGQSLPVARIFVAIPVPADLGASLGRATARTRSSAPAARWTAPAALHITLAFLGDVPFARLPEVLGACFEVTLQHAPIDLVCVGAGVFKGKRPKVLWAGLIGATAALEAVHRDLLASLQPLGVPPAQHPFAAHITLARAEDPNGDPALVRCASALQDSDFGAMRAAEMVLYRSDGPPRHHAYTPIARLPFRGRDGASAKPALEELEERIRAAYLRVTGGKLNESVTLAKLRAELPGAPREAVDEELRRMQQEHVAVLYPIDDPRRLRPEDHAAAMRVAGERRDIVALTR